MIIRSKQGDIIFEGENLSDFDLSDADLSYYPSLILNPWNATFIHGFIAIGCQTHTINEWKSFTRCRINKMHYRASWFWRENKALIIGAAIEIQKK